MQNERSGSNSRRRDAAAQRRLQLQEASSNINEEELEAGVPHLRIGSVRSHSVGPRRQSLRGSYSGHGRAEPPPGSEESADTGPSNSQPPALEYYRPSDEECEGQPALHADVLSKLHILTNCSCIINNECLTSIVFKVSFCLQLSCPCL